MEVWKIIFLSKWVIWRFHVNLLGCMAIFGLTFKFAYAIWMAWHVPKFTNPKELSHDEWWCHGMSKTYLFNEISWVSISRVWGISIGGSRLLVLMPWKRKSSSSVSRCFVSSISGGLFRWISSNLQAYENNLKVSLLLTHVIELFDAGVYWCLPLEK